MEAFDVAIVGAGPAGAAAAARLASGGAKVALLDDSHPREKPCGGGVTGRALSLVGGAVQALAQAVPIESAAFAHRGRAVCLPLHDETAGLRLTVSSRRTFDGHLVERARGAGVVLLETRVTNVERADRRWRLQTRDGEPIDAKWVIGADGPASLVRRRVSIAFDRADLSIAAGYYVHGATSTRIDIAFLEDPSGYLWSFPRSDHLAVGACAQADEATAAGLMKLSAGWIDANVGDGTRERYSWPIPSLRPETVERQRPAGEGWFLAGDAAGLVDPITREGIFFALTSGLHAAESILHAPDPASAYTERLRDTIYSELLLAARLKARFYRPGFMALLVSALQRSSRIRSVMSDLVAGEQPYHSLRRRLLATLELRLMLELFGTRGA